MSKGGVAQNGQPGSPPEPLRFVNLDRSNLGRDPSTKKLVRSHVMQRYRRGKALKTPTPSPLPSPPVLREMKAPTSPAELLAEVLGRLQNAGYACSCSKPSACRRRSSNGSLASETSSSEKANASPLLTVCEDCGGCTRVSAKASNAAPTTMLGAGKKDPFNTLPLRDQTQSFYLLDHYSHVVLSLSLPMNDHQIKWFKRALADEGLLHSLLLYAAKHNEIITGASREVEIYCHRGEVMRIVTERLGSNRDKLIDTTIDAVACLVLFEEMFGVHDVANAHRSGLEQLVTLRGGLDSLGAGSPLYKLVVWAGKEHSLLPIWEMAGYGPFLNSPDQPHPHSHPHFKGPLPLSPYTSASHIPFDYLPPVQIELFYRLRNSTILISSLSSRSASFSSIVTPSTPATDILAASLENNEQYVLKARICEELALERQQAEPDRKVAWLIAIVLYASAVLSVELKKRDVGEQRKVVEGLVGGLRAALDVEMEWCDIRHSVRSRGADMDMYAASVLLWILFVGGVSTDCFELEEQSKWFSSTLRELCAALGLGDWDGVKGCMKDLPLPGGEEGPGGRWRRWWGRSVEEFRR